MSTYITFGISREECIIQKIINVNMINSIQSNLSTLFPPPRGVFLKAIPDDVEISLKQN